MSDLREQIMDEIYNGVIEHFNYERILESSKVKRDSALVRFTADTILALIPKPTVRVLCDKCEDGKIWDKCHHAIKTDKAACKGNSCAIARDCVCDFDGRIIFVCPSCTDGWNEHEIVYAFPNGGDYVGLMPLTLLHLIDPDVAHAYWMLGDSKSTMNMGESSIIGRTCNWIDNATIPHNKGSLRIGEKV